jgi:FKBP-type peptidyl-prolyl cis-trans isomerase SlyD
MSTEIAEGMVVSIHYTLKNDDGDVLDSSSGGEPLAYLHGAENIVPGLERQLTGRTTGDKFEAVVQPAEGYGERSEIDPQKVPRDAFPDGADLQEGMQVVAQGPSGKFPLWVVGVGDDHVMLDPNHPLAGVTLHFEIEVQSVRDATEEEISHGHVH